MAAGYQGHAAVFLFTASDTLRLPPVDVLDPAVGVMGGECVLALEEQHPFAILRQVARLLANGVAGSRPDQAQVGMSKRLLPARVAGGAVERTGGDVIDEDLEAHGPPFHDILFPHHSLAST